MFRRLRRSCFFPYTTLFRSFDRDKLARSLETAVRKRNVDPERIDRAVTGIQRQLESSGEIEIASGEIGRDRKSTRLNSSHVKISYAVFCSKKKTMNVRSEEH